MFLSLDIKGRDILVDPMTAAFPNLVNKVRAAALISRRCDHAVAVIQGCLGNSIPESGRAIQTGAFWLMIISFIIIPVLL